MVMPLEVHHPELPAKAGNKHTHSILDIITIFELVCMIGDLVCHEVYQSLQNNIFLYYVCM